MELKDSGSGLAGCVHVPTGLDVTVISTEIAHRSSPKDRVDSQEGGHKTTRLLGFKTDVAITFVSEASTAFTLPDPIVGDH